MGRDPRSSVVDADCRVHGYSNLYVAGSSVFSTSGWANPTLTIIALALRLADHLAEKASTVEESARLVKAV
jgi:choline dehydrogenase-like flavoprotein